MELPYPAALFDNLDVLFLEFQEQNKLYAAGVVSEGDAAAYALVWEWGNARQTQKGPKTTQGINPNGDRVWLSIQAPFGYVRINELYYWQIVNEEMDKVKFDGSDTGDISQALLACTKRIGKRIADVIKEAAPVDSGDLRRSIKAVDGDDSILDDARNSKETLVFD